jgi:hypothetical protein
MDFHSPKLAWRDVLLIRFMVYVFSSKASLTYRASVSV